MNYYFSCIICHIAVKSIVMSDYTDKVYRGLPVRTDRIWGSGGVKMKTINKIFMAIAVIILTPTVMLVAFILVADATDMDLESMVWEVGTETETALLAEGETAGSETAAGENAEVPPAEAVPPEGEASYENAGEAPSDGNNLAANPPANWTPTANNGAIQQQLNMDAWNANPGMVSGTNSGTDTNAQNVNLPDAAAYLKACLDVAFKNDSSAYTSLNIGTAEEAENLYEESLDEETLEEILGSLGFSDVDADERLELIKRVLASVHYNVGEAKKQADGSYVVTVAYEKMNIYMPTVNSYIKKAESMIAGWNRASSSGGEVPSFEKMNEQLIETYTECMREALGNVTYEKSQNATIRLKVVNNEYEINEEDTAKFGALLTDSDEAMKKLDEAMKKWDF